MPVDNHTHSGLWGDGGNILSSAISIGPLGAAYARLGARGTFDYRAGGTDLYHLKLGNNLKPEHNRDKLVSDKPAASIVLEHDIYLYPGAGGRVNLASASTSGTAGSLAGYFEIKILGTRYKVPYYNL